MRPKVIKEPEQMVSLVMKERVCEKVDKIVDKLDVSRGYVIR